MAIGVPGWPELAACTASIDNVRIVLMHIVSRSFVSFVLTSGMMLSLGQKQLFVTFFKSRSKYPHTGRRDVGGQRQVLPGGPACH